MLAGAVLALLVSAVASPWIVREVSASHGPDARAVGPSGVAMMRGGPGGAGMMGRTGMMSGRVWPARNGAAVGSIAAARERATAAASASGLRPGEIIQFRDNFYVELQDSAGASVTEVLVDPATGAVTTEPGPAMMWNSGSRSSTVTAEQARSIAEGWLRTNRSGETVLSVDAYPGYYTLDTAATGRPAGMVSVNATTGAVWYHTWHGAFVAEEDS